MNKYSNMIIGLHHAGKVTDATLVKMAAFRDELEKHAMDPNIVPFLRYLATGLLLSGGIGIGAAGVSVAKKTYEEYRDKQEMTPAFTEMLRQHPELKEDKDLAEKYFEALYKFSPIIAKNPISAGAYVKQAMAMHHVAQGPLPAMVKELIDTQRLHQMAKAQQTGKSPFGIATESLIESPKNMLPSFMSFKDFAGA